jgi:hypothetical protein
MVFLGLVRWLEDERQTEVAQFGVAIGVNQDVLRLETKQIKLDKI